jgi:hypothetical protein
MEQYGEKEKTATTVKEAFDREIVKIKSLCPQFKEEFKNHTLMDSPDNEFLGLFAIMEEYMHQYHKILIRSGEKHIYGYAGDRLICVREIENSFLLTKFTVILIMMDYINNPF